MVEVEARIIANVEIQGGGAEPDLELEKVNFREVMIEALKKVDRVVSARVEVIGSDGKVLARANFARDPM